MQTTDYKQGTKCSVHTCSTDLLGTKSLDCDKKYSLKQLLVTNCEDAGFIFKHAKIKVSNVMQPTKNRKKNGSLPLYSSLINYSSCFNIN